MMKRFLLLPLMAISMLLAVPAAHADGERFVLISHAPDSDSWWNSIKNALKLAGEQMNVEVQYRNPSSGDIADMARIVEQVAASNPDGVIVTIADYNALSRVLWRVTQKGIPLITINSGTHEQSEALGALLHIGQPEYDAGYAAGKRAQKEADVKSFVCVNHVITNPASVERCKGFADAIGVELEGNMIDSGLDPTTVQNKVAAHLRTHPDVDAVLTLGPPTASPALRALEQMKITDQVYFGTFDLSDDIARAIKDGKIAFAIDQQPFLQGYLPVVLLTNYVRFGVMPSNHINSGPGFITKANIAQVEALAGEYR